jgi:hypothetical protein
MRKQKRRHQAPFSIDVVPAQTGVHLERKNGGRVARRFLLIVIPAKAGIQLLLETRPS